METEGLRSFGGLLRFHRERLGWSQPRLAEKADCHETTVSRWEAGSRRPTREAVEAVIAALGLKEAEADEMRVTAGFAPVGDRVLRAVYGRAAACSR